MEKQPQLHTIAPIYDGRSKILILGSFPSVKSREAAFFYAHPQNRFWPTLALLFGEEVPKTVEEKRSLALRHGVALWDTVGSCEIAGSSDASITNVVPNDLRVILDAADIGAMRERVDFVLCAVDMKKEEIAALEEAEGGHAPYLVEVLNKDEESRVRRLEAASRL